MKQHLPIILSWLSDKLNVNQDNINIIPITNDASLRCYYRCFVNDSTYIVMDSISEPSLENFIEISEMLTTCGLSVPKIHHADLVKRLVLLQDFGDDLYLHILNKEPEKADQLYKQAMQELLLLQSYKRPKNLAIKQMNALYIAKNLQIFHHWFLDKHLQIKNNKIEPLITFMQTIFASTFTKQPQVLVHLDYHSRNLMLLPQQKIGILDFQDLMYGPIIYDLVSLFQDAYIVWPEEKINKWLLNYQALATKAKILPFINFSQFRYWFDLVGLQRHIKNLGVFARLNHRDQKSQYLHNIPTLLNYIISTCKKYSELAELHNFFADIINMEEVLCKQ